MSTDQVPGFNKANGDKLATGCWAEHEDGTLIFVEGTENFRVIFSIFDMDKTPIIEYRTAMSEDDFKKKFSFSNGGTSKIKWTWHDKTNFPWDKIIAKGADEGTRFADTKDLLAKADNIRASNKKIMTKKTAAQTAAEDLMEQGNAVSRDKIDSSKRERNMKKFANSLARLMEKHFPVDAE